MPLFARTFQFDPDDPGVQAARPDHRAHIQELHGCGQVRMSGPWASMDGALIIYEAQDQAAAQQLVASDPYSERGLVTKLALREWNVVVG